MSNARDKANIPALNFSSTGIDDNATSTAITIDSSENVGIGTSSPSVPLTVFKASDSAINLQNSTSGVTNVDGLQFLLSGSNGYMWNYENGANIFGTNNTERMRINSSGNVGIGTSSPSEKLEVSSSINTFIKSKTTAGAGIGGFKAFNNGSTEIKLFSYGTAYSGTFAGVTNANLSLLEAQASSNLLFSTWSNAGGSNPDIMFAPQRNVKLIIKDSGNVGIGTTSPSAMLDISNSADVTQLRLSRTVSGTSTMKIEGSGFLHINNTSNAGITFSTNNTERISINNAGKIFTNQTAQFHNCVTIGGAQFTGDFQIEISGLQALNGNAHRRYGMRLSYASIAGNASDAQQKDVLLNIGGLTSYGVQTIDTGGGTIAVTLNSASSTSLTFTVTTPGASTVGAYVATLFANDNSTMECNG